MFAVSSMFLFIYWIYKRRKIPQFSHVSKIQFCCLIIYEGLLFDVYLYNIFSHYPIPNQNILNDSQFSFGYNIANLLVNLLFPSYVIVTSTKNLIFDMQFNQ